MTEKIEEYIEKLEKTHSLSLEEYEALLRERDRDAEELLKEKAVAVRKRIYGNKVFIRGLIEFSSYCKNDCYYCGIRASNKNADRYRLCEEEILDCVNEGYSLGFRTFVLQSGEDTYFNDERLCGIVRKIKEKHPDCAVTLSVGERTFESYKALKEAGADRYLLRHETASPEHYAKLHPAKQTFERRIQALHDLRKAGFAVGAGFMVGSPYQTVENLARDLKFIEEFSPEMCGIGPFIPHKDTIFAGKSFDESSRENESPFKAGSADLTCYLLSIIRLIKPNILLPATTALGTVKADGREKGILSGANVVMPNLSPLGVRKKYSLYDGKICLGEESAQCLECLKRRVEKIGYQIVVDRGDIETYQ